MRRPLALVLLMALATACGSTVQSTSVVGGSVPIGDGLSTAPTTTGGAAPVVGGPQSVTGTTGGALPGTAGGATSTSGTTGVVDPTTGMPVTGPTSDGRSGPGVSAKEIRIGFVHDPNAGAVNKAAGVGAISSGDPSANVRAILDDINKHGGVAGRKLVPVFAQFDSTSTQTLEQQWSAVCQTFTKDSPVLFTIEAGTAAFRDCMARAGAGIISASLPTVGDSGFRSHPYFIDMGYPNVDRLAAYLPTSLMEQKYFTPWNVVSGQPAPTGAVKVGVITYNDGVFTHAVDQVLVPALKKLGFTPLVERVAEVNTASDYGAQAASVKNAQLAFAANGVTHVIPFESNGGLSTFFMPTARAQGYYPRLGINSASAPEALLEAGAADGSQYNGAVGFGWIPSVDLAHADYAADGPYSNANRRACLKVMRDHGISFDSGNAEGIALSSCADIYLMVEALKGVTGAINPQVLFSRAQALGATYQPAGSVGITFQPGRRDPADRAYHYTYVASCGCMRYSGSPRLVP